ncbi:MAG: fibronectin type III domain-containing protein, partial [Acidobacteria bacterium]|nr:fibronectin type III domain-containing protein [Acidobacteriota bacterium]
GNGGAGGRPPGLGGNGGVGGTGGNGGVGGTGPIDCTDANLDRLARATGGEVHALETDAHCVVVHRFTSDGEFRITTRMTFPMQTLVVGGGGGAGGGSGWDDTLKASGAEPDSGAGAGGAGGEVLGADVSIDAATGAFTYTPRDPSSDGAYIYTPGVGSTAPSNIVTPVPVTVGRGGNGGNAGSSAPGTTVGGQGGNGGASAFGDLIARGGTGGFGGQGAEGATAGVQNGSATSPRAGGRKGGSNGIHWGADIGLTPAIDHAAPGGAGAGEDGHLPVAVGSGRGGNGGDGGAGVAAPGMSPTGKTILVGDGGGGGTINPASPPYTPVVGGSGGNGGTGGLLSTGGKGGAGGVGGDAPDGYGGGGGGGGTDGSVTVGDSNAGRGGNGGAGAVYVRYLAAAAPATPPAPTVVAGDGSVTVSFDQFDDTTDYHVVWVAGDPSRSCTITPSTPTCVIEGLANGESYTFLAFAGNAAGESPTSVESVAVTPGVEAGTLPYTGGDSRGLVSLALTITGLGGVITAITRRRRSTIG